MFSPRGSPQVFGPEIKLNNAYDHVAKFRGDQPRDLADLALKKEKRIKTVVSF